MAKSGVHCACVQVISLIAAGGFKFGGDREQRIGVPLVALVLLTLAYWLSSVFSTQVFGYQVNGLAWSALGAASAFAAMRATQDWVEAYKWFSLAAANDHNRSLKDRAIIKRRMSPIEITMAESLIRDYERAKNEAPRNRRSIEWNLTS